MGIKMDIDLTAGLLKPKIALTELPALAASDQSTGALPDFAALLSGAPPDEPSVPAGPALDVPMQFAVALSEAPMQEAAPEEGETAVVEAKMTADKPERPTDKSASNAPEWSLVPQELTAATLPSHTAEASAMNRISAPATPEQAAKAAEFAPGLRLQADTQATAVRRQKHDIPTDSSPVTAAPKTKPDTKVPAALFAPLPLDRPASAQRVMAPDEPRADMPMLSAKTPPKNSTQAPALPAPTFGFSNSETVTDAPDDLQFGIKIERQTVEITGPSRVAPQAAPVATQITAQLPQMLTKAEKQTVELRLDPPELGRVTIHLTTNDQQVTATVTAERVDTVDLMRRHAELLTATLARAGFSQADLSFQQGQGQNGKAEFEQFQGLTSMIEGDDPAEHTPTLTGQDGRLDIRL